MDTLLNFALSLEGFLWMAFLIVMIYLVIRRINIKKTERFEKRSN